VCHCSAVVLAAQFEQQFLMPKKPAQWISQNATCYPQSDEAEQQDSFTLPGVLQALLATPRRSVLEKGLR
jgi:hypothetical protein